MTRRLLRTALALLLLAAAPLAFAADLKVATVDMGQVTTKYEALQNRSKELQEWLNKQQDYLTRLGDYLLLSDGNFAEVVTLLNTAPPLPADKAARLKELGELAVAKEDTFHQLESNPKRTPQEEEQYKSLGDQLTRGRERLSAAGIKIGADHDQQVSAAREDFMKKVLEVTEALAKQDGYNLVLDSGVVLVGGTDITDKVLAKLNNK